MSELALHYLAVMHDAQRRVPKLVSGTAIRSLATLIANNENVLSNEDKATLLAIGALALNPKDDELQAAEIAKGALNRAAKRMTGAD